MAAPTLNVATISLTQIEVQWLALSGDDNGGATIDSYNLQYDQGTSTWIDLLGEDTNFQVGLSHTETGLTGGTTYKFRVRAHNEHGWGSFSTETSIVASSVPDTPAAVTTSINNQNVRFTWVAPTSNHQTIDAYKLKIKTSSSTYVEELTYCDGSDSGIVSQLYCEIPMSVFISSPYSLSPNTLIEAKV